MKCSNPTLRQIRGAEVAMIFQEPMTSLNPVFTAGAQIEESLKLHRGMTAEEAEAEAVRLLELVRIPDAARVAKRYPHQLSGGMRQRVMIAMALACRPQLLIADEPTTALDVTVQAQILALIKKLQEKIGMAVLFITHDMVIVELPHDRRGIFAGDAEKVQDEGEDFVAVDVPAGIHDDVQDADGLTAQGEGVLGACRNEAAAEHARNGVEFIGNTEDAAHVGRGSSSPAKRG